MRLPASSRRGRPALNVPPGTRSWRILLLGMAAFVPAFLLGFLLTISSRPLEQTLVDHFKQHHATAELGELAFFPPFSLQGRQMTVRVDNSDLPPVAVEHFTIRPLWRSLLSTRPGVEIDAELLQGQLQATVRKGGRVEVQANGLHFLLPLEKGAATVTGTLSAGQLQWTSTDRQAEDLALSLTFGVLSAQSPLLAGTTQRPLNLGQLTLVADGPGPALNISRLEASGGDVSLSGTGSILLGRSLRESRVNLVLRLHPAPSFPDGLRELLDLNSPPGGDGGYQLNISGPLPLPLFQIGSAAGMTGS